LDVATIAVVNNYNYYTYTITLQCTVVG